VPNLDGNKAIDRPEHKSGLGRGYLAQGKTLQAIALYWHTATDSARRQNAMGILQDGYQFYTDNKTRDWWVDDFGWLGGFFGDLLIKPERFHCLGHSTKATC
jgi:hypothetical protein